jgi:2-methylcitrate dehydratase PrpD
MSSQREVQYRGLRDILEAPLEQIHRRHSTGALVGAGAAAGVAGLVPC